MEFHIKKYLMENKESFSPSVPPHTHTLGENESIDYTDYFIVVEISKIDTFDNHNMLPIQKWQIFVFG